MTKNQIEYGKLEETIRSNKANEALGNRNARENERHNYATERETYRSNVARETFNFQQLGETRRSNLAKEAEEHRSNVAREIETNRANVAREVETNRHNVVGEGQNLVSLGISQGSLLENKRHNLSNEILEGRKAQTGIISGLLRFIPGVANLFKE